MICQQVDVSLQREHEVLVIETRLYVEDLQSVSTEVLGPPSLSMLFAKHSEISQTVCYLKTFVTMDAAMHFDRFGVTSFSLFGLSKLFLCPSEVHDGIRKSVP